MLQITSVIPDNYSVYNNGKRQRYICGFQAQDKSVVYVYIDSYRGVPSIDEIEMFVLSLADYCSNFELYLQNLENDCSIDVEDDDTYDSIEYEWETAQAFESIVGRKLLDELRVKHNW